MRIGLHLSVQSYGRPWHEVLNEAMDDAALADDLGLSSVLFAEHHFVEDAWNPQPLTLAAAAAARTTRVAVGTDIQISPLIHPVALAENAAIVDALSGGRCVLGLGAGWKEPDYRGFGLDFRRRYRAFEESIDVARRLLRGEEVTFEGTYYAAEAARLRIAPVQEGGPPVWIGATGPQGIRRAARLADAWVMSPQVRLATLREQQQDYLAAREEAGLPAPRVRPIRREGFVAETTERAWELFAAGIHHEYGVVYRERHPSYPADGDPAAIRRWADDLFVVGSPDDVTEQLERLRDELGITETMVRVHLPGIEPAESRRALELFGEVADRFPATGPLTVA